ncbi:hypothetical protein ACJWDR_01670 [Streptomyces tauricus]|uniref:hypothetical protein n=1 Tax=Streptomyces tauricus TaxID=68274 RepID=UPI00387F24ED
MPSCTTPQPPSLSWRTADAFRHVRAAAYNGGELDHGAAVVRAFGESLARAGFTQPAPEGTGGLNAAPRVVARFAHGTIQVPISDMVPDSVDEPTVAVLHSDVKAWIVFGLGEGR